MHTWAMFIEERTLPRSAYAPDRIASMLNLWSGEIGTTMNGNGKESGKGKTASIRARRSLRGS